MFNAVQEANKTFFFRNPALNGWISYHAIKVPTNLFNVIKCDRNKKRDS